MEDRRQYLSESRRKPTREFVNGTKPDFEAIIDLPVMHYS